MPASDFLAILRELAARDVEFIVVGGVGAVLQGAPISTFDLDIVHATNRVNVQRLLGALDSLGARYRMQPERAIRPEASHLASPGHQLLMTRFGPLDVFGMIGRAHSYEDLLPDTIALDAGPGVTVRILKLERLITVKEETAGEKDIAVLPVLRRTLRESNRG